MSGLLLGILLARTVSGIVAELGGWRLIYALAAVAMLVLAVVAAARAAARRAAGAHALPAAAAARSATLVREEPVLRAPDGARASSRWRPSAALDVDLVPARGPQYGYGEAVIGLFSLAGLAGAGDRDVRRARRRPRARPLAGTRLAAGDVLASWGLLALGANSLARADRRHRRARPRRPGDPDPQPERDLPAAARGAQPAHDGLPDVLLRRRGVRLGGRLVRVGATAAGAPCRAPAPPWPRSAVLLSLATVSFSILASSRGLSRRVGRAGPRACRRRPSRP